MKTNLKIGSKKGRGSVNSFNKLKKICLRPLKEVVILSDGRITTCCLDPKGINTFASIYDDNFEKTFFKKFQKFKQKFVKNIDDFPFCVKCFDRNKNFYNDFYRENPSEEEISLFLDDKTIPRGLVIELTSFCNLKCLGCVSGLTIQKEYRKGGFLDCSVLKNWIIPGIDKIKAIRLYNYGETFLHPGSLDFCLFLTSNNPLLNLSIATNILLLNTEEKREKLIEAQPNSLFVSLHGASQESCEKYMGPKTNFKLALDIMRKIILVRKKYGLDFPVIIWKYLLLIYNDSDREMTAAKSIFDKWGIDFLAFDIAAGPFASKRFFKGSKEFEELKNDEYYIRNVGERIVRQKLSRKFLNKNINYK